MAVSESQKKLNQEPQSKELVVQREGASVGVSSAGAPEAPGEQLWASATELGNTVVLDEVSRNQQVQDDTFARVDEAAAKFKEEQATEGE